ncbi:MAG: hypothetical protein Q8R92_05595, partial [Deltaproteobacteria bacterium]|nr:hypothetical protein [Deltaproteobacteria bacterium]
IRSVAGEQINNAQEIRYLPREQGDVKANEGLTSAASWFRDQCDADDEESDAFWDSSICGIGVTDSRLDMDDDPDEPMPVVERIDPLEMVWDCDARKRNLSDARRWWRVRDKPIVWAREKFPDIPDSDLNAGWAKVDDDGQVSDRDEDNRYDETSASVSDSDKSTEDDDRTVTIVQCQWLELKPFYKVADPGTGQAVDVPAAKFEAGLKDKLDVLGIKYVKLNRKIFRQAFIGRTILELRDLKCPHFTFNCITAFRDRIAGTWYGIVRAMKDPQRWANKWLSQTLHIMNANAKGGMMMETDAVEDVKEFEKTYSATDQITWVQPGTLSGQSPKFLAKPQAQFPTGFYQLMEFAISSVRDVAGINLEMLGMREADQPASLEYQRRQAGVTILAQLFRSLRRYHRNQGKVLLYYIQNLLSPQTLVKIIGTDGRQQFQPLETVRAMKSASVKYDIIVDEGPTSPNQKERVWALIGEKFWGLPPEIQIALLEYSPFPESVVEKVKQAAKQASEGPQAEQAKKMMQLEAMLTEAKVLLTRAQAGKAQADAVKTATEVGVEPNGDGGDDGTLDYESRMQELQARTETDRLRIAADAETKMVQTEADVAAKREKIAADVATEQAWMDTQERQSERKGALDAGVKLATAAIKERNKPDPKSAAKRPGGE